MARYVFQIILLVVACLYASFRGGRFERQCAGVLASMFLVDAAFHFFVALPASYRGFELFHFLLDLVIMALLLAVALRSDSVWPMWIAAAQVISLLSHVVRVINPGFEPVAYAVMMRAPSWSQICFLIIAVWRRQTG